VATVECECECSAILRRLLEAVKDNDNLVLFRTFARVFRSLQAMKATATVRFHRQVRVKEVAVLCVVFLVVLPTIKEIPNYFLLYIKIKGVIFCAFIVS
jgi:hypothetical protein